MMWDYIKKSVNQAITEPNNHTICPIRVMGIGGSLYGLVAHVHSIFWLHQAFDLSQFGIGLGSIIGAMGLAMGFKKDSP